ncbi:hypothetical protein J2S40_004695 [Nocardioides luteus]|uniref:Uncharacterized protein n=1 Tax=Nocardioides luteus TaxID=1844 RepID=A0ABQ5T5Y5_9ACTN|nr:hypothetical protein [Nocardioides luteus]MDR7313637.1 hypothetical protein [Nocardioides luteus]GGR64336.1 hypothetical protein GCM10010197_34820 [Nocardioides luteus]GLJ70516.1 hypothetical protein GCM10017579_45520 [Nocardioides luteus]
MTTPGAQGEARRTPWAFETSRCAATVTPEAIEFRFMVTGPDGSLSEMLLSVGRHDMPTLLEEIAFEMPEAVEWMSAAIMTVARERRLADEASAVPHQRGA